MPETDLVDGHAHVQQQDAERMKEKNYYFRLSKYRDRCLSLLRRSPISCSLIFGAMKSGRSSKLGSRSPHQPNVLSLGHSAFPVTRTRDLRLVRRADRTTSPPSVSDTVPTSARFATAGGWPSVIHLIGKDIVSATTRLCWPAMLLSAGLPLPRPVFGHGFWMTLAGNDVQVAWQMSPGITDVVDVFGVGSAPRTS